MLSAPARLFRWAAGAEGAPSEPVLLVLLAVTTLPGPAEGLTVPLPSGGSSIDSRASPMGRRAGGSGNHIAVANRKASQAAAIAQPIEVMALTGRPATWRSEEGREEAGLGRDHPIQCSTALLSAQQGKSAV